MKYCKDSLYTALRYFRKNLDQDCECDGECEVLDDGDTEKILKALADVDTLAAQLAAAKEENAALESRLAEAEKRVEVLDDVNTDLVNGFRCADCEDTGLLENRVDGKHPCTCITETDFWEWNESHLRESEGREASMVEAIGSACAQLSATGTVGSALETLLTAVDILPARTAAVLAVLDAALAFHDDPTNNEKAEQFSKACHAYKEKC